MYFIRKEIANIEFKTLLQRFVEKYGSDNVIYRALTKNGVDSFVRFKTFTMPREKPFGYEEKTELKKRSRGKTRFPRRGKKPKTFTQEFIKLRF